MTDVRLIQSNAPAAHRRAIGFCSDTRYLPFAAFAASQIAALHPERTFDIFIVSNEALPEIPVLARHGIRLLQVDMGTRFTGLRLDARRTEAVYLRLALPALLAETYDRILYLDSDIYCARDGMSTLLDADMLGSAVAAVRDNIQWRTPGRQPEQYRRFGWPSGPYFNSGVTMIDTEAFGQQDLEARCIAFGQEHKDRLVGHDQTLLNCVLRGAWAEMSPRWNWQFTWASSLFALTEDARILHFIGPKKPWQTHDGVFPGFITRAFRDFLATHFPDRCPEPAAQTPLQDRSKMMKSMGKHMLSCHKMAAYLARFPDDMVLQTPG
ncbi:glycosyltransferase family 8 protein [Dinoroseobacter sp. S375]|uniref:glycosyltransferase family 8 protein n=1 Tax=Dinoroseobacter sp. S375 TaxID=3415136 RepID=UPI003C79E5C2